MDLRDINDNKFKLNLAMKGLTRAYKIIDSWSDDDYFASSVQAYLSEKGIDNYKHFSTYLSSLEIKAFMSQDYAGYSMKADTANYWRIVLLIGNLIEALNESNDEGKNMSSEFYQAMSDIADELEDFELLKWFINYYGYEFNLEEKTNVVTLISSKVSGVADSIDNSPLKENKSKIDYRRVISHYFSPGTHTIEEKRVDLYKMSMIWDEYHVAIKKISQERQKPINSKELGIDNSYWKSVGELWHQLDYVFNNAGASIRHAEATKDIDISSDDLDNIMDMILSAYSILGNKKLK